MTQGLKPKDIYEAIGKLHIVNITLDRDQDGAQAVFESLNSTGKALSESDLIRNYVLMGLAPGEQEQEDIYKTRRNMESFFGGEKRNDAMDNFSAII